MYTVLGTRRYGGVERNKKVENKSEAEPRNKYKKRRSFEYGDRIDGTQSVSSGPSGMDS